MKGKNKLFYGLVIFVILIIGIMFDNHNVYAAISGVDTESDGINVGEFYFDESKRYDFDNEDKLKIYLDIDSSLSASKVSDVKIAGKSINDKYINIMDDTLEISNEALTNYVAGSYELGIYSSKNSVYRIQLLLDKESKTSAKKNKDTDLGHFYYDSKKHPDYYELKLETKGYSSFYLMTYMSGMGISEDFTYDGETLRIYSKRYEGKISGAFELSCYDSNNDEYITYTFILNEISVKHPYSTNAVFSTKNVTVGNKYSLNSGASKLKGITTDYLTTDSSIATVSKSGIITVKKEGKVYVSAFVNNDGYWIEHKILLVAKKGNKTGKTYNFTKLTMKNNIPTITLSKDLYVNSKMQISDKIHDDNLVKFSTKNKKIAYLKDGYIIGKSIGKTTVSSIVSTVLYDWETGDETTIKLAKFDFNITVLKK